MGLHGYKRSTTHEGMKMATPPLYKQKTAEHKQFGGLAISRLLRNRQEDP
jgi:hypothetical protein